jgi:hypothetical protein
MPPFRIPFTSKKPATPTGFNDENVLPISNGTDIQSPYRDKPSLALGTKGSKAEPNEFKLSCKMTCDPVEAIRGSSRPQRSMTAANTFPCVHPGAKLSEVAHNSPAFPK